MTTLKERLHTDVVTHMKDRNKVALTTVRNVLGEIETREKSGKTPIVLDDAQVTALLQKEAAKRRDTARIYTEAGEAERAAAEIAEAEVIEAYLPKPLTAAEVETIVDEAIAALHQMIGEAKQRESLSAFLSKRFSKPIFLAIIIAFFNQVSGINAIIYFAPRVFELAGIDKHGAFLQSVGVGLVNLVFTMLGLYLIDRIGRKKLMLIGSIGYIISLSAVAAAFYFNYLGGMIVPTLLFIFIASHAVGQGAVIWVFISEVFPNSVRAYGQSLGASTHWILAAIITTVFPILAVRIGPAPIFTFFAFMMVLQLLWVIFVMPETKGKSLEELEVSLV